MLADPRSDLHWIVALAECSRQPDIRSEEPGDRSATRSASRAKLAEIASCKRLAPPPIALKRMAEAGSDGINRCFAPQDRICQRFVKRDAAHDELAAKHSNESGLA
jgi:hypothetical protein